MEAIRCLPLENILFLEVGNKMSTCNILSEKCQCRNKMKFLREYKQRNLKFCVRN